MKRILFLHLKPRNKSAEAEEVAGGGLGLLPDLVLARTSPSSSKVLVRSDALLTIRLTTTQHNPGSLPVRGRHKGIEQRTFQFGFGFGACARSSEPGSVDGVDFGRRRNRRRAGIGHLRQKQRSAGRHHRPWHRRRPVVRLADRRGRRHPLALGRPGRRPHLGAVMRVASWPCSTASCATPRAWASRSAPICRSRF